MSASTPLSVAAFRSRVATFAPSARSRCAAAAPIPLAPPVTSATRPENRLSLKGTPTALASQPKASRHELRSDQRLPARQPSAGPRLDAGRHSARRGDAQAVEAGRISGRRQATPETLRRQAAVARAAGREPLAESLERAAELALVADDELLEIYTALRWAAPRRAQLRSWAARLEATRRRARRRSCGRRRPSTSSEGCSRVRSRRFEARERRELAASCSCHRIPSSASWRRTGRGRSRGRSCSSRTGSSCAAGRPRGLRLRRDRPLRRRARARPRGRGRGDGARRPRARADARRRRRAAAGARAPRARPDAGEARARDRAARPGRADARAQEAPRAPLPLEPGARHEPEGEPGAARGGRGRGRRARLRRDRDDRRRRALRAAERDRAPGRLADRPARRDDPVRGRGAAQPRAGDPRSRHLRRDAVGLRHRAGLRGRRRHALVEGVPRRGLRLARRQGALHLGTAPRR